jgi:hypothetical protein
MENFWYLWQDSESKIPIPKEFDHKRYDSLEAACNAASDLVHRYDWQKERIIIHVEDYLHDETVYTTENIIQV